MKFIFMFVSALLVSVNASAEVLDCKVVRVSGMFDAWVQPAVGDPIQIDTDATTIPMLRFGNHALPTPSNFTQISQSPSVVFQGKNVWEEMTLTVSRNDCRVADAVLEAHYRGPIPAIAEMTCE